MQNDIYIVKDNMFTKNAHIILNLELFETLQGLRNERNSEQQK